MVNEGVCSFEHVSLVRRKEGGGGYSFIACLSYTAIDHGSLARRSWGGLQRRGY